MHFGQICTVNGITLDSAAEQRYLGVQVYGYLKAVSQVNSMAKNTFGMLVFTGKGIEYKPGTS